MEVHPVEMHPIQVRGTHLPTVHVKEAEEQPEQSALAAATGTHDRAAAACRGGVRGEWRVRGG